MNRRTFLAAVSAVPALAAGDILIDNTPRRARTPRARLTDFQDVVYTVARAFPNIALVMNDGRALRRCADSLAYELRVTYQAGDCTMFGSVFLTDGGIYAEKVSKWEAQVRALFEHADETQRNGRPDWIRA